MCGLAATLPGAGDTLMPPTSAEPAGVAGRHGGELAVVDSSPRPAEPVASAATPQPRATIATTIAAVLSIQARAGNPYERRPGPGGRAASRAATP